MLTPVMFWQAISNKPIRILFRTPFWINLLNISEYVMRFAVRSSTCCWISESSSRTYS